MKKLLGSHIPTIAAVAVFAVVSGCALFSANTPAEQRVTEIKNLSCAASSIGVSAAIRANPALQPQFEIAYNDLNRLVEAKAVTGLFLRNIIASLPIKELKSPTAQIAIDSVTMLYDATIGDKINIENEPYVLAAATGLRDGFKVALGK